MPQILRIGSYQIYFWINMGMTMDPVHVQESEGSPAENATKIWITKSGNCLQYTNNLKNPYP